ncbi:DUF7504 family protein [Halobacterium jilantaiense]|nr:hypothetical protein [Halobacterium jilantaiense]
MNGDVDAQAFSTELAELKRGGCTVLVASDAPGRSAACQRLLGAPELDRSHVFLTTSADVSEILDRHRPRRTDPGSFAVVDATPDTRSAAAASAATTPQPAAGDDWYARVSDQTDFDDLYATTRDALDRVASDADAPSEVRLCLDGLDPLLEAVEAGDASEEGLFRLLHLLSGAVRDVDGMGHVHVSETVGDGRLGTFEPLFDATVDIETTATGDARQRWRLHDSGRETGWFQL